MYKNKYSAQESLQRIKLMMGYDMAKTATENINEQVKKNVNELGSVQGFNNQKTSETPKTTTDEKSDNKNSNVLTDNDLLGETGWISNWWHQIHDFSPIGFPNIWDVLGLNFANLITGRRTNVKGVVDALDGWVDEKDLAYVLGTITALAGKCYYDDVEQKTISATERFLQLYKEDEGDELIDDVNNVGTKTLPTGTEKIKQKIVKLINDQVAQGCTASSVKNAPNTFNKARVQIPTELKDKNGVMAFQTYLDQKYPQGWAVRADGTKYITGGKPEMGYGRYGSNTARMWAGPDGEDYKKQLQGKSTKPATEVVNNTPGTPTQTQPAYQMSDKTKQAAAAAGLT